MPPLPPRIVSVETPQVDLVAAPVPPVMLWPPALPSEQLPLRRRLIVLPEVPRMLSLPVHKNPAGTAEDRLGPAATADRVAGAANYRLNAAVRAVSLWFGCDRRPLPL